MDRNDSHYNKNHQLLACQLRNDSTPGEVWLWNKVLRARRFYGYQFNRQYPIGDYIANFICRQLRLFVEIDGYSHRFKARSDQVRDRKLAELEYRVMRVIEQEVREDLDNVVRLLEQYVPEERR